MKKELNLCNLYIVLWLISYFQSMIGAGNIESLMISVPGMIITLYCFILMIWQKNKPSTIVRWMFFFVFLVIYGLLAVAKGKGNTFLLMVLTSVGPLISFYYFTTKGLLTEKHLLFWFFVFILLTTVGFYNQEIRYSELVTSSNYYEGH